MHGALSQFDPQDSALAWDAAVPARPASSPMAAAPYVPSVYGARPVRWSTIAAVIAGHVFLLILLVSLDIVQPPRLKRPPTVVTLIELPVDPPASAPPPSQAEPVPVVAKQPVIVAPPPKVQLAAPNPPPVQAVAEPPPQRAVIVTQAQPGPSGPVSAADLASTMISARPPKYPVESRRKREQGTVVLTVLVGTSGNVVDVSVAKSSGFDRLDKAALAAVRGWRWSPTMRDGQPVMVKGYVDIPFMLTG